MQRTPPRSPAHREDAWPSASLCEVVRVLPESPGQRAPLDPEGGTVLVLPGNPGVPGYYGRFARGLADELGAEVVVLGFCGHTLRPRTEPWKVFSLEDQIEHVVGYIDSVHGDGKLTIVGHSIGAYIGLEAMRRRPKTVRHVLGLTPFLENNDADPSFARLKLLALLPGPLFWPVLGTLCLALAAVKMLPRTPRRMLASLQTRGFDPEWVDFTADAMLQPGVFANYAFMGRTELRHLARRYDFTAHLGAGAGGLPEGLAGRTTLLYTDSDYWAPEALVPAARAAGVAVELREGLRHAFSTRAASCAWVTAWAARQLRRLRGGPA